MPIAHLLKVASLTEKQLILIGKITVEWSNIESLQKQLLTRLLLSPDFIGRVYTDRISAAGITIAIKQALEIHQYRYQSKILGRTLEQKILHTLNRIDKSRAQRNRIAHFCWSRRSDTEIFGMSFSSGLPGTKKHEKSICLVSNTKLEALYNESYLLVDLLRKLLEHVAEVNEQVIVLSRKKSNLYGEP